MGVGFQAAKTRFPNYELFRDTEQHFALSALVSNVTHSKNVLVFLPPNYASSPFCVVELSMAFKSGANIMSLSP